MKTTIRLTLAAACLAAGLVAHAAQAAEFPTKPITMVVPFAPGGPTDAMARTLANAVKLGQPVLVDNRAGAGGNIGAEAVARAERDGHMLLFGTSGPLAINVSLYKKIGYDPVKSFAPVIQIGHLPNVLVVRALGVTTKDRSQALPDVPTVAEQGVAGFDVSVFFGLVVPAGTPRDVIDKLNHAFAEVLKQPEVRKTLLSQGLEFAPSTTPEQLAGFIQSEVVKWRGVVKTSGAEID